MISPSTSLTYMLAAYAVILVVMGLYLGSLWTRWRNLQRDLEALDEIENHRNQRRQNNS